MPIIVVPKRYYINPLDKFFCGKCEHRKQSPLGSYCAVFEDMPLVEDLLNSDTRRLDICREKTDPDFVRFPQKEC